MANGAGFVFLLPYILIQWRALAYALSEAINATGEPYCSRRKIPPLVIPCSKFSSAAPCVICGSFAGREVSKGFTGLSYSQSLAVLNTVSAGPIDPTHSIRSLVTVLSLLHSPYYLLRSSLPPHQLVHLPTSNTTISLLPTTDSPLIQPSKNPPSTPRDMPPRHALPPLLPPPLSQSHQRDPNSNLHPLPGPPPRPQRAKPLRSMTYCAKVVKSGIRREEGQRTAGRRRRRGDSWR